MSKIEFRATIRDTPASLRFGAEIPSVTLDVCPADESAAVALIALKKTALKVTVEIDDGALTRTNENGKGKTKGGTEADSKQAHRRAARDPFNVARG